MRCCSSAAARLFDSISAARSVSVSVDFPLGVARRPLLGPLRRDRRQPVEHADRRVALRQRRRVEERLERRSGLPPAAPGAVELRLAEIPAADQRQHVAGRRIDRHQRRLQVVVAEAVQPAFDRALRRLLQLRHERRLHAPVGRMVAAEAIAELLAQELLGVAEARLDRAGVRPDARPRLRRRLLLRRGDEPFLAHARAARRGCDRARRRDSTTARAPTGRGSGRRSAPPPAASACSPACRTGSRDIVSTP